MSRPITAFQTMSARVVVMFLMTAALMRQRVGVLRTEPERGGGGMSTLEMVLLGVAGAAAAGVVIAAIGTSIGNSVDTLP